MKESEIYIQKSTVGGGALMLNEAREFSRLETIEELEKIVKEMEDNINQERVVMKNRKDYHYNDVLQAASICHITDRYISILQSRIDSLNSVNKG